MKARGCQTPNASFRVVCYRSWTIPRWSSFLDIVTVIFLFLSRPRNKADAAECRLTDTDTDRWTLCVPLVGPVSTPITNRNVSRKSGRHMHSINQCIGSTAISSSILRVKMGRLFGCSREGSKPLKQAERGDSAYTHRHHVPIATAELLAKSFAATVHGQLSPITARPCSAAAASLLPAANRVNSSSSIVAPKLLLSCLQHRRLSKSSHSRHEKSKGKCFGFSKNRILKHQETLRDRRPSVSILLAASETDFQVRTTSSSIEKNSIMICRAPLPVGRLNAFQRVMLQWSELHPYNAAHTYRLSGPLCFDAPCVRRSKTHWNTTASELPKSIPTAFGIAITSTIRLACLKSSWLPAISRRTIVWRLTCRGN